MPEQESEYIKCTQCGKQIKKTRFNRTFCNDSCRVKHHLKLKGKKVMLLSNEEYKLIMEMRAKNGNDVEAESIRKVGKTVKTEDQRMMIDNPDPSYTQAASNESADSIIEMEI